MLLLDKNENLFGPSNRCIATMCEGIHTDINMYNRNKSDEIEINLSNKFNVPAEFIFLGYGSEEILKQIFYYCISKDNRCLVPEFTWDYYHDLLSFFKYEISHYPLIDKIDHFEYEHDSIIKLINEYNPALVVLPNPNNPTGNIFSYIQIKTILDNIPSEVHVVLDEAYWGYGSEETQSERIVCQYPNMAIVRSFSKYYALAGLRAGYCIAGENFLSLASFNKRYLGFNRISEKIIKVTLESESYYREIKNLTKKGIDKIFRFAQMHNLQPYLTYANFILIKVSTDVMELLKAELPNQNIYIRYITNNIYGNFIRISIGREVQVDRLLTVLDSLLPV